MRARLSTLTLVLTLAFVLPAHAGGPLLIFDASTRTPWAYSGTVDIYTDTGAMGPTLTNAEADALTSFGFGEWTSVTEGARSRTRPTTVAWR